MGALVGVLAAWHLLTTVLGVISPLRFPAPVEVAKALWQIVVEGYSNGQWHGRVRALAPHFERAVHALADAPGVVSIRNIGLAAVIELAPLPGAPGRRGAEVQAAAFAAGLLTRAPGDTLVLAPPFICTPGDIDRMVDLLRGAIQAQATATGAPA